MLDDELNVHEGQHLVAMHMMQSDHNGSDDDDDDGGGGGSTSPCVCVCFVTL